jgi:hypothetical protein
LKKVCFVVSHLGSGSGSLVAALNSHPQCEIRESPTCYESPSSVRWLFRLGHKCRDASAVYGDHLLLNPSIATKSLYGLCRFVFVIRPARHSLEGTLARGYSPEAASSYYRFRLRRICEMVRRCPGAPVFSWEDLAKESSMDIIKEYLGIRGELRPPSPDTPASDLCPEPVVERCQDAYERYHYYLKRRRPIDQDA